MVASDAFEAGAAAQALALVAASAACAPLALRAARSVFPGRNVFFARWGFSHLALLLALIAAASLAARQLEGALGWSEPGPVHSLGLQSVLFLPVVGFIVATANVLDPDGWRCLGLRREHTARALALGVLGYLACLPGLLGVHGLWRAALELSGVSYVEQALASQARASSGGELAAFAVLGVVVAPLLEELIFRAFIQPLLVQNLGDRGGVVVTALVFAAAHANVGAFAPLFALGLLLGALMLRSQRLIAPVLAHALHNGLMLLSLTSAAPPGGVLP